MPTNKAKNVTSLINSPSCVPFSFVTGCLSSFFSSNKRNVHSIQREKNKEFSETRDTFHNEVNDVPEQESEACLPPSIHNS